MRRLLWLLIVTSCDPACGRPTEAPPPAETSVSDYDHEWRKPAAPRKPTRRPLLDAVTSDLPAGDALVATIETSAGTLQCRLWPDKAPQTVAGFVWLANAAHAYDGSRFTRVIQQKAVYGARPDEPPGWPAADERFDGMHHREPGLLCSHARDDASAAELMITVGDASIFDKQSHNAFTVFGRCSPQAVVQAMADVPADRGRPREPLIVRRIRVARTE